MGDLKRDKDSTKQFQKERFGAFPPPADNEVDDFDGPIDPSDPIFGSRMSSRDLPKTRRVNFDTSVAGMLPIDHAGSTEAGLGTQA